MGQEFLMLVPNSYLEMCKSLFWGGVFSVLGFLPFFHFVLFSVYTDNGKY